ncbi:MAG: diacylglycerol kinase family protein [Kiritimatiellaeota bacterium]|nr:diacylglycerol kinase family protein [Kiritimatiellota bacterium]
MNLQLVMNPGSRSGRGQKLWTLWEEGLRRSGIHFECKVTERPGDAFRISKEARGFDAVVAIGGDGTINEVLDGLIQSGNPSVRMGVLYSGTSPDFCRFHAIPTNPAQALRCLIEGHTKRVDVVRITYSGEGGTKQVAHFGCSCNIGLGAAVARYANRWRKSLGDGLGTGLAVVNAILFSAPVDLDLEIDGTACPLVRVNHLAILKNPHIASGLKLNLDLQADDGKLKLVAVHGQSRFGLCALLPGFYSGKAVERKSVFMKDCTSIKIRSGETQELEFDGDPRGYLPAEIQILPKALNLIVDAHE